MVKNESKIDRIIRAVVGVVFLLTGYMWFSAPWNYVFYVLGAISLFTAITGFCALYMLFRISTLKTPPTV